MYEPTPIDHAPRPSIRVELGALRIALDQIEIDWQCQTLALYGANLAALLNSENKDLLITISDVTTAVKINRVLEYSTNMRGHTVRLSIYAPTYDAA